MLSHQGNRWSPRENMQPSITLGKSPQQGQQASDNGWGWGDAETEATGGVIQTLIDTVWGDSGPDTVVYEQAESQPAAPAGMNTGMAVTIGVVALLGVGALVMMGRK